MESYINYLLQDIAKAERPEAAYLATEIEESQSLEAHFADIERWLEGEEPAHTFSYYSGLEKEQFPPAEKLTELQLVQVNKAFRHLLFTWNLDAYIPEEVPSSIAHSLLVSVLDEKTDIPSSGFMTFEFCNYDSESCPFGDFCSCKDDEIEDMGTSTLPEGELPF